MKKLFFALLLSFGLLAHGQGESGVDAEISILSSYYWRGFSQYPVPILQSDATFYHKSLSFNLWSVTSLDGKCWDMAFTPAWTLGNFSVWISDYYCPVFGEENNFLSFSKEKTAHSTEIAFGYEAGKLPLNLSVNTFFFGDYDEDSGKPCYSTYFQADYPFSIAGLDARLELGLTPWAGYYSDKLSVVHLGLGLSHQLELSNNASIPFGISFNLNPNSKQAFIVMQLGLGKSFSK